MDVCNSATPFLKILVTIWGGRLCGAEGEYPNADNTGNKMNLMKGEPFIQPALCKINIFA